MAATSGYLRTASSLVSSAALEALQKEAYDLILIDVQLPKMDGNEATRQIRAGNAGEKNRDIPILAVTAHTQAEDRQSCLAAGMNAYIPKPVNKPALFEQINAFLGSKQEIKTMPAEGSNSKTPLAKLPVFNRDSFVERVLGDVEIARQVAVRAIDDIAQHSIGLSEALESADSEKLHFHAHSLKGVSKLMECHQLATCAEALDRLSTNQMTDARKEAEPLLPLIKAAIEALNDFCSEKSL